MIDHTSNTVDLLDRNLNESFTPTIFGKEQVQGYLLQITYIPVIMSVLGIYQHTREYPLNHNTYRASTAHAVVDILGVLVFNPLAHGSAMVSVHTAGRAHNYNTYGI